jgi:hypothetical protein|tara:strand:+ start:9579 stop:10406 length:828 start_codon:yes stop_codon:yes gene_type:complete
MSTRDRYTKIIESLVNGDEASASDLLHEAFVEKAREIWNDIVEADEIVEDGVAEEEIEEAIGNEEADDFLDDIETDEDEIEAEEAFGEAEDDQMDDLEAAEELGGDEEMAPDFDMDGETDEHEEEHGDIEDKLVSVEDALDDLKAEFAKIMGDEEAEDEMEMPAMDMDMEPEVEEAFTEEADKSEEGETELDEAAELKAVSAPANTGGDDGKASPVAGKNDMGGKTVDMTKDSKGSSKGLSDNSAKDMGVAHPGDGAKLSPNAAGHGAEKKGKAE